MITMTNRYLLLIICLIAFSYPSVAWKIDGTCGENKVKNAIHRHVTFNIDSCLSPPQSEQHDVIDYAIKKWNGLYGMYDRFSYRHGSHSCDYSIETGHWEIAFVEKFEQGLDERAGVTIHDEIDGCNNNGELLGATILINDDGDDVVTSPLTELDYRLGARETLIHELGHVLGMKHEDNWMSVMCTDNGCGRFQDTCRLKFTFMPPDLLPYFV